METYPVTRWLQLVLFASTVVAMACAPVAPLAEAPPALPAAAPAPPPPPAAEAPPAANAVPPPAPTVVPKPATPESLPTPPPATAAPTSAPLPSTPPAELGMLPVVPVAPVITAASGQTAGYDKPVLNAEGIFLPPLLDPSKPVQVLVALHGMGGRGNVIGQRLGECASTNGWVVIAPTMAYRNYMDPEQVLLDDQATLPWLRNLVDSLPITVGGAPIKTTDRVMLYGFSRGAQVAHRFALFYPDKVASVVALSAGSYTLPRRTARVGSQDKPLAFPYGVADLERYAGVPFDAKLVARVPFLVGVGSADNGTAGVPRPWDPYEGSTRVERAQAFTRSVKEIGGNALLDVFSGASHEETARMRAEACDFMASQTRVRQR